VAALVALPALFAAAALAQRYALRWLPRERPGDGLLATAGLAIVLGAVAHAAQDAAGGGPPPVRAAAELPGQLLGGVPVAWAIAAGVALLTAVLVHAFLRHTDLGRALRATAQDAEAAQLLGVDVRFTGAVAAGLAAALAGLAGILLAGLRPVTAASGAGFTARALVLALVARRGSAASAVLAGLALGAVEGAAAGLGGGAERAGDLAACALLLLLLLVRPGRLAAAAEAG
jgi:branched-chain amino acid transport system permease protein